MKKLFACMLRLSILSGSVAFSEIDLSGMTFSELASLRDQVDEEITLHHTSDLECEKKVQGLVKDAVEAALAEGGSVNVEWPWFDYHYTCDWDLYTLKTRVRFKRGKETVAAEVWAEAYPESGDYALFYLSVGDTVITDRRDALPAFPPDAA